MTDDGRVTLLVVCPPGVDEFHLEPVTFANAGSVTVMHHLPSVLKIASHLGRNPTNADLSTAQFGPDADLLTPGPIHRLTLFRKGTSLTSDVLEVVLEGRDGLGNRWTVAERWTPATDPLVIAATNWSQEPDSDFVARYEDWDSEPSYADVRLVRPGDGPMPSAASWTGNWTGTFERNDTP